VLRSRLALAIVLLTGCDRVWRIDELASPGDAGVADNSDIDAPVDALVCFGSPDGLFKPCINPPQGDLRLSGDLETASDPRCTLMAQTTGIQVCVIAAQNNEVTAPLVARGNYPVVLIASGTLRVNAPIDASSNANRKGAGGQGVCGTAGQGTDAPNGGGGGAGASFGYQGGGPAPGGGVTTTAHAADPPELLVDVRGGCTGYRGGVSTTAGGIAGAGGRSGGAVYLIAGESIFVSSTINVSGGGGAGGPVRGGGGGGGSGGLIGFDAPALVVMAELIARGGGGGSGGSDAAAGNRGTEPVNATGNTPGGAAATGTGSGPGWPGCGGPNGTTGGNNAGGTAAAGGGGGGGACGYIRSYAVSTTTSGSTSPRVTP
jgi:hypothetical protein